jgi:glutathione S-transferase
VSYEKVPVDLRGGEHLSEAFRAINPRCTVPVLELDDGTRIAENDGIAAYVEAAFPEPALLGKTAVERGLVAMWNARVTLEGFLPLQFALRHQTPGLRGRAYTGPTSYQQIPELAAQGRSRVQEFFEHLAGQLDKSGYVALDSFSLADITALVCVDFAAWVKMPVVEQPPSVRQWYERVTTRSSAQA